MNNLTMTKRELKNKAIVSFQFNYGFSPSAKSIILLEADNHNYILVEVNCHQYRIDGLKIEKLS